MSPTATTAADIWLREGGAATLRSYGVSSARELPSEHLAWMRSLPLRYDDGRRFFVHAGIDPEKPLDAQSDHDLIWIREPFLSDRRDHGRLIVHGHTPQSSRYAGFAQQSAKPRYRRRVRRPFDSRRVCRGTARSDRVSPSRLIMRARGGFSSVFAVACVDLRGNLSQVDFDGAQPPIGAGSSGLILLPDSRGGAIVKQKSARSEGKPVVRRPAQSSPRRPSHKEPGAETPKPQSRVGARRPCGSPPRSSGWRPSSKLRVRASAISKTASTSIRSPRRSIAAASSANSSAPSPTSSATGRARP